MVEYKVRMVNAIRAIQSAQSQALSKLIQKTPSTQAQQPFVYTSVNVSDFVHHLGHNAFVALVYNPLAQPQKSWIRIPVSEANSFKVADAEGKEVTGVNFVPITDKVRSLEGHHKEITHEIVFEAQLPALGYTTYFVTKEAAKLAENKQELAKNADQDLVLHGKGFELVVNHVTGKIAELTKTGGAKHKLAQSFAFYTGKSDAYEFCPHGPAEDLSTHTPMKVVHAAKYAGYSEVTSNAGNWVSQTIRVYEDRDYAEIDWVVGPIGEEDHKSKEFIVRFDTDLKSKGTWYTDSNGRQNMKRERSSQTRECHSQHQTVTYNYYPATTRAILRDEEAKSAELLVVSDRSVGASSLKDGEIEVMIHRRCFSEEGLWIVTDDKENNGKGVEARGKLRLYLNDLNAEADIERQASREIFMQPVVALNPVDSVDEYKKAHNLHYTALKAPLPDNLHLLTLQNWGPVGNNEVLVRIENFYQPDDKSKLAVDGKVSLDGLFTGLQIEKVEKVNLVGGHREELKSHEVTVKPQEIDSFVVKVKRTLVNSACSFKWEKLAADKKLPARAIHGGNEQSGSPLYICRHLNEDLIPGKYSDGIHCHVTYGGGEQQFDDAEIEILTAPEGSHYQWAPRHGGDPFPDTVFVAGHKKDGIPLYVGRCTKKGEGVQVGKIDEYFYYGYSGGEHKDCVDHEVLSC